MLFLRIFSVSKRLDLGWCCSCGGVDAAGIAWCLIVAIYERQDRVRRR